MITGDFERAIDAFAAEMKRKMRAKERQGYIGWDRPYLEEGLRRALHMHLDKGDPIDVANFAMMLWNLGART